MTQPRLGIRRKKLDNYFYKLANLLCATEVTSANGAPLDFGDVVDWVMNQARAVHAAGYKLIFVGNGGSAAIASHMATDYSKSGGVRAMALTICRC